MKNRISWNDITLGDFIEIQAISQTDELDDTTKTIELLRIISHNDNIDELTVPEFNKQLFYLELLKQEIPHNKIKKQYTLGGIKYNAVTNIEKLTTAQYIDYINITKEKTDLSTIGKIVAVLLVPEGKKYGEGYDFEELCNLVESEMPITEVFGIADFFVKALHLSSNHLLNSLIKMIVKSNLSFKEKLKVVVMIKRYQKQLISLLTME